MVNALIFHSFFHRVGSTCSLQINLNSVPHKKKYSYHEICPNSNEYLSTLLAAAIFISKQTFDLFPFDCYQQYLMFHIGIFLISVFFIYSYWKTIAKQRNVEK